MRLPLDCFTEWVRSTDTHAARRLQLLDQAQSILSGNLPADHGDRQHLAEQLERWRYQLLNRQAGQASDEADRLAHNLDLAVGQLTGRRAVGPRAARASVLAVTGAGPTAEPATLEQNARRQTERHFPAASPAARRVLLYAPIYLSSHCINYCQYCSFRYPEPIKRKHLDVEEVRQQAELLRQRGFQQILLVAGDFPRLTSTDYFVEIIRPLVTAGFRISVEIAPQSTPSYAAMVDAGAEAVTLYQETYDPALYAAYHARGSKASYDWRLEGLDRAAEAGMRRLGLGVLVGLAEPREELERLIRHGRYLQSRFPDRQLAFSLPRIHEAPRDFSVPHPVDDELFVRMYCTLRLAFPTAELVLSTREPPALRNRLAGICITQMSAGSSTAPGGYDADGQTSCDGQFPIHDDRSPREIVDWLTSAGLTVLFH